MASLSANFDPIMEAVLSFCPWDTLVGETGTSLRPGTKGENWLSEKMDPSSATCDCFSLLGDWMGVGPLLLGLPGVLGRMTVLGDAETEGRRKGEVRGEPKERGEGLYGVVFGVT